VIFSKTMNETPSGSAICGSGHAAQPRAVSSAFRFSTAKTVYFA
jgi:hypothetical protein